MKRFYQTAFKTSSREKPPPLQSKRSSFYVQNIFQIITAFHFPTGSQFPTRHRKVCIKSCKPWWSCWGNPVWVCTHDGRHNTGNQRLLRLTQSMFLQLCFAQFRTGLLLVHWGPHSLTLMDIAAKSLWISILYYELCILENSFHFSSVSELWFSSQ